MNANAVQTCESSAKDAKQVLTGLINVFKKLNLYSDTHTVYQNALIILKKIFDEFFVKFGNLKIQIERNTILHEGELLYEGGTEPTDLAFLLHRDGILWLEFQDGLELWEIDTFYKVLRDHCILDEDPADDIVTALWALNLPSILYEAADLELGFPEDMDFSALLCADDQSADSEQLDEPAQQCETIYSGMASHVLMQDGQSELWELTADENDQLRQMIAAEEQLDGSDHAIDALLHILENHCLKEDINELLDTLLQELEAALTHARFSYLLETVARLKKNVIENSILPDWIAPFIQKFLAKLATRPFLSGLERIGPNDQNFQEPQLVDLERFLCLLDVSTTAALGPIMMNVRSAALQRIILKAIGTMAMSDFSPLESLITGSDPVLTGRLVFLLGYLKDPRSRHVLSNLVHHPSKTIRIAALKALMARDDDAIDEIFRLMDDADESTRKQILQRLAQDRSARVENKLLDYLKNYHLESNDEQHFIDLCRTLGQCGSEHSIPYLTGLLFKWPRFGVLSPVNSTRRRGALVALKALETKKAARLINMSNRGFFKNFLRSA